MRENNPIIALPMAAKTEAMALREGWGQRGGGGRGSRADARADDSHGVGWGGVRFDWMRDLNLESESVWMLGIERWKDRSYNAHGTDPTSWHDATPLPVLEVTQSRCCVTVTALASTLVASR